MQGWDVMGRKRRRRAVPGARPIPQRTRSRYAPLARGAGADEQNWSPEQIAGKLKRMYPDNSGKHVSHETIYAHIYAYPRGSSARNSSSSCASRKNPQTPRPRQRQARTFAGHHPHCRASEGHAETRVKLHFIPTYCPGLNPIEGYKASCTETSQAKSATQLAPSRRSTLVFCLKRFRGIGRTFYNSSPTISASSTQRIFGSREMKYGVENAWAHRHIPH